MLAETGIQSQENSILQQNITENLREAVLCPESRWD